MKNKITIRLKYYYLFFLLLFLITCQENVQKDENCSKFAKEIYKDEVFDSSLFKSAVDYQNILLKRFDENSVKGLNFEAYHLQFYSSHGYGKSVKFENEYGIYSIAVKCRTTEYWLPDSDCKEYQIEIDSAEWNELEKMVYEFDFWTVKNFKTNKDVLDGYVYLLEGNRPQAEKCNKKTYKLVARSSPRFDKMGALCDYILEYEEQLKFKYEQLNKIK